MNIRRPVNRAIRNIARSPRRGLRRLGRGMARMTGVRTD